MHELTYFVRILPPDFCPLSYSSKYVRRLFLEMDLFSIRQNELEEEDEPDNRLLNLQNILPQDILSRASSMSLSPLNSHRGISLATLCFYLPTPEVAMNLRTTYYTHAAWM